MKVFVLFEFEWVTPDLAMKVVVSFGVSLY